MVSATRSASTALAAARSRPRRASQLAGAATALRAEIGIPHTLAGLKVDDRQFDLMSRMAVQDPTAGGNPVPLDAAVCRRLYENALAGEV